MSCISTTERKTLKALAQMAYSNPFTPERIEYEKELLGEKFDPSDNVWSLTNVGEERPNLEAVVKLTIVMIDEIRTRLIDGKRLSKSDAKLYYETVNYHLYRGYHQYFGDFITDSLKDKDAKISFFDDYMKEATHYLAIDGVPKEYINKIQHMFACFFQIRRTFHYIYTYIIGRSEAAAKLRAAIWDSVLTRDLSRFLDIYYCRMGDFATLVQGPSGTGKELVARAVGMSRYIPFNAKTKRFEADFSDAFYALNIAALSPTLVESELFGHRKGAFTGAVEDRKGWLESCPEHGAVFLDEIGELDMAIQAKLLRVFESRVFSRLGETEIRDFPGKLIAATNRDLHKEMSEGTFRHDFYYRICSDVITTPSLREQLDDSGDELALLVQHIVRQIVGDNQDNSEEIAGEVTTWIQKNIPADYEWPGNMRELSQCVRNVILRGNYKPMTIPMASGAEKVIDDFKNANLTADEMLSAYTTIAYKKFNTYEETGRRLGLDRRTVKAKVSLPKK